VQSTPVLSPEAPPSSPATKFEIQFSAAQARLAENFYILPLDKDGKRPLASWLNEQGYVRRWQNGVHSVYSASNGKPREYITPKTGKKRMTQFALQSWWDGLEGNPAVALELSGLTVIDIDGGILDEDELIAFCHHFGLPITRCIRSGRTSSFGCHLYFKGISQSWSFSIPWKDRQVKGEIKSQDKYVVAEGSVHKSGLQYTRLWNIPMLEVPTTLADIFKPMKTAVIPDNAVPLDADGQAPAITQKQFESWADKNGESFTLAGFHDAKQSWKYLREAGCPWQDKHEGENQDTDFAIFVPISGKWSANCVHESCKSEWTESSCWLSYRAFLEKTHGKILMQPTGKIIFGKNMKTIKTPVSAPVALEEI